MMNGTAWKTVFAGLIVALVAALWTGNARLASVETILQGLPAQLQGFNARITYLERLPMRERPPR